MSGIPTLLTLARFPLAAALPFLAGSAPWFPVVLGLALTVGVATPRLGRRSRSTSRIAQRWLIEPEE